MIRVIRFQSLRSKLVKVSYRSLSSERSNIFSNTDSIGSALFHPSFHPSQPMLLTCSGTRTFDAEEEDSSDEEEAEACLAKEDSLKIWSL